VPAAQTLRASISRVRPPDRDPDEPPSKSARKREALDLQALGEALIEPVRTQASGEEILHTVSAWMAAGMRVEPAAQRLFIHANTVRYRLRRYEELTGTDLSVTDEAFRVWWAIHRDQAGAA